ncbi:MAG TPA: tRNA pseudouridine synthase A [Terriglobia bacterium]|nr:tRNA pseudouridine synthase A [Terriglobia bacterium]
MPAKTTKGARRNLRLLLAYDGSSFHGWQRQPGLATVQACVEDSITGIVREPVKLYGSGRTDAGVHALGQVANFTTSCRIPAANLQRALNDILPADIRVRTVDEVAPDFHARYAVRSKIYRYRILQANVCPPFLWRYVWHYPHALDRRSMARAARVFAGTHDFTSFAATGADADDDAPRPEDSILPPLRVPQEKHDHSMVRTIFSSRILWRDRSAMLAYDVRCSGFLHHMVRNIVGTLVEVGRGRLAPGEVAAILQARDRTLAGPTAPPQGLCLMRVAY